MKEFFKIISIFLTFIFLSSCSDNNESNKSKKLAESYANLVSHYYEETDKKTKSMSLAINDFLNELI